MRIAVDAMGGDHAPAEVVKGVIMASMLTQAHLILVGHPDRIQACLAGPLPQNVRIHPASEVVGMDEKPTEAIRKKKDSSLSVGARLVAEGEADALVSAGNTGAAAAVSLLTWRPVPGIHRPAIAAIFPNKHGQFVLLDAGASPDVDPEHLVAFGQMGQIFARLVMDKPAAMVHLLNIGEEPGKGNAFAKQAHELMSRQDWFAGNIEGKDIFHSPCDVVVCDAFVGNTVLKVAEGVAEFIRDEIRSAVPKGPGRVLFLPMNLALGPLRKKMDYAEYGGMPLLGLNGLCVIGHGRSNAKAIKNACMMAVRASEARLVETIRESFAQGVHEAAS